MIGKTISHYKILEKLGEGGMGVVFKAHDTKLDRFVALKFLPPHLTKSQTEKERFIQEAKAASAINHPNVCIIYDLQEHDDQQFIIMEYVDGETLSEKIKSGNVDKKVAIDYAIQISDALKTAHEKGIIHRDIKSENIMITTTGQIKVMDFGLAKLKGSLKLTKTSSTLGTLAYMSPEQIQSKEIDARSDIFSFGVVLYEMLSGQLPFQGEYDSAMMYSILNNEPEPIQKYYSDVPSEMIHILDRSLEKESEERYQTFKELLIELNRIKKWKSKSSEASLTLMNNFQKQKRKRKIFSLISIPTVLFLFMLVTYLITSKNNNPAWLELKSPQRQLTFEPGENFGSISPDGNRIVYIQDGKKLLVKNFNTGYTNEIEFEKENIYGVTWSPDGLKFALVAGFLNNTLKLLVISQYGDMIYQEDILGQSLIPTWSPDGKSIAICHNLLIPKKTSIKTVNLKTNHSKIYDINSKSNGWCLFASWSPNSRYIAFIEQTKFASKSGTIKLLELETGLITQILNEPHVASQYWQHMGLSWSPDGRYLVYTGNKNEERELFALYLNSEGNRALQAATAITNLQGIGVPCWPYFSKDGRKLSFSISRFDFDINIMSLDIKKLKISEGKTIAKSVEYEKPECWLGDGKEIIFTSGRESKWDIYRFNLNTEKIERITNTQEREWNVKKIPGKNEISYYQEGAIWSIPTNKKRPAKKLSPDSLKLSECYTWSSNDSIIYVTTKDSTDDYLNIIKLNLKTKEYEEVHTGLLPFNADMALSPNGKLLAVAGVAIPDNENIQNLLLIDLSTGDKTNVRQESIIGPQGKISWTQDGKYISNDENIDGIMYFELIPTDGNHPLKLKFESSLEGDYYLHQIDPKGEKILMSKFNIQADIWQRGDFNN